MVSGPRDGVDVNFSGMPDRVKQVVVFLHEHYHHTSKDGKPGSVEFVDCGNTLERITKWDEKALQVTCSNPWKPFLPDVYPTLLYRRPLLGLALQGCRCADGMREKNSCF